MAAQAQVPVGILVVAHGELAHGLLGAAEEILGPQDGIAALRLDPADGDPRRLLEQKLEQVDRGAGVLALTDLFGGTPANVTLAVADGVRLDVLTGASLPMLLRALSRRDRMDLSELATDVAEYGRSQVMLPNQLLRQTGKP